MGWVATCPQRGQPATGAGVRAAGMGSWMAAGERKSRYRTPLAPRLRRALSEAAATGAKSRLWDSLYHWSGGGAARSVSTHGMQISCVRRGVRWAGLSSVCLCVTGVGPKNQLFLEMCALVFSVRRPRSACLENLGGIRVDMLCISFQGAADELPFSNLEL